MITPEGFRRAKRIFERALKLPSDGRRRFVEEEARGEPEVLEEVLGLLEAYREEDDFLETPASGWFEGSDEEEKEGRRVGPYRILRMVGAGGMGVVYEAERADDLYRKRVAVKFVKRGMDSDLIVRRFRREREILAALDHPNIASLLDGGVTDDGQPYFVMEFVEGRPIRRYCDEERLSVRDRIRLFGDVCAAVHFAHQNLVIHRDLKPANLLVTGDGTVKLLDFGVAKLLHSPFDPTLALTAIGGRVLTPAYASPEQIQGRAVTTVSDVYALGVILYELLTGRRPFEGGDVSLEEMARRVCSEDPTRPSEAVRLDPTVPITGSEARLLRQRLEGELDNIVMMAIRKEPERRYSSAAELGEDLRRYLHGFPVVAQRDTAGYRLRKFVQRHRGAVFAAALAGTAMGIGGGAALWQARVAQMERALAEARFDQVRELATTLLFDVHDAIAELPGATAARELVVARGFEYLERLALQSGGDSILDRDVAEGYLRLGGILGNPAGASLGDLEGARNAFMRAEAVASAIVERSPGDLDARRILAEVHRRLGDVLAWSGEVEEGIRHLERSLALYEAVADGRGPLDEEAHLEVVVAHVKLGDLTGHPVFPNLDDPRGALARYEVALSLLASPPLAAGESWGVRRFRGLTEERVGAMHRLAGEPDRALVHMYRSLEIRRELAREDPAHLNALRDVAIGHQLICEVYREMGRPTEAADECRLAAADFRRLRELDPENHQALVDMARIHGSLARTLEAAGDEPGAVEAVLEAIRSREELLTRDPGSAFNRRDLAELHLRHALLRLRGPVGGPADPGAGPEARASVERARSLLVALRDEGLDIAPQEALLREADSLLP